MKKHLQVAQLSADNFHVKVGGVNFQIDRKHLGSLMQQMAEALGVNMVEDEQLKEIFYRYDALRIHHPTLKVHLNANINSTKDKPLGGK